MSTRREFLVNTSSAALGAAVTGALGQPASQASGVQVARASEPLPYSSEELFQSGPQRTFAGEQLLKSPCPWEASEPVACV